MTGIIVAVLLGWLGGYRFYKKQYGLGVLYLLTFGLFCIGWIVDIIVAIKEYKGNAAPSPISQDPTAQVQTVPIEPTFYLHSSKDTDKNINQIRTRFIVVDTETTGVNSKYDRMISVASIIYENGMPTHRFYSLVNQPVSIPADATKVNHITNDMIKSAPSEHDVCKSLLEFWGDAVFGKTLFVAYNSSFDFQIIKNAMERYQFAGNVRHFDVLQYARNNIPNLPNYKQSTVADHLGINSADAHNAMADCEMCAQILLHIVRAL